MIIIIVMMVEYEAILQLLADVNVPTKANQIDDVIN